MKKLLALLLVLALLVSLSGCGLSAAQQILEDLTAESESTDVTEPKDEADAPDAEGAPEPLSLRSMPRQIMEYGETDGAVCSAWEEILLPEEMRTAFPALHTALTELDRQEETYAQALLEDLWKKAVGEDAFCENDSSFTVRRADTNFVSLLYRNWYSAVGAHPGNTYTAVNLDTQTGAVLQLVDIFTDPALLAQAIWDELAAAYPDVLYEDASVDTVKQMMDAELLQWVLDPAGLTVIFSERDIAPYMAGTLVVTIPYSWYPEQFDERCARLPDAYAVELDALGDVPVFFDVDAADGYMDSVSIDPVTEDGAFVDSLRAVINGTAYELATELTGEQRAYLLRLPDGSACIYLFASSGPWQTLYVASLGAGGVSGVKTLPDAAQVCYITKEYEEIYEQLTDPQSFRLAFYVEMLGSLSGIRAYVAGADGMPMTLQKDYLLENELVLTLLQPMTFERKAGGEQDFPEGTEMKFLATDGETWVDMQADTGDAVRIYVDKSDWPDRVNGMEVFEIFDGMMYAG